MASAIIRECVDRAKGVPTPIGKLGVWLDSPMIDMLSGEGTVEKEFPGKFILYKRFDIDISKEPMLIYPTLHYQNGGIKIDTSGATTVPGFFAAGECTGGVHGRNRLIGNSTLDLFVFGRRAGRAAAQYSRDVKRGSPTLEHVRRWQQELQRAGLVGKRPVSPRILPDYVRRAPASVRQAI